MLCSSLLFYNIIVYLISKDQFGGVRTLRYGRFGVVTYSMTPAVAKLERPLQGRRVALYYYSDYNALKLPFFLSSPSCISAN
jgi:hypothetical protein